MRCSIRFYKFGDQKQILPSMELPLQDSNSKVGNYRC